MKNSGDNVFRRCSVGPEEAALVRDYLDGHDLRQIPERRSSKTYGNSPGGSPLPTMNRSELPGSQPGTSPIFVIAFAGNAIRP